MVTAMQLPDLRGKGMKKRNIAALIVMMACLSACGGQEADQTASNAATEAQEASSESSEADAATTEESPASTEAEEPAADALDLTGQWVTESSDDGTMMVANIEGGAVSVFYIIADDDTPWTYWVGTYDAPTTDEDAWSWTSTSTYTGNGLMASGDDTKDFSYKNGALSFDWYLQDEKYQIDMTRGEWDMTNVPAELLGEAATATIEYIPLEVKDSGWTIRSGYLFAYADIYNPMDTAGVEYLTIRVTARDASGAVLGTGELYANMIYPQQDYVAGSQVFAIDEEPATVEFSVLEPEDYNLKKASGLDPYTPLEVVNPVIRDGKITGEISNSNDYMIDSAKLVVVCRDADGNVVDVCFTYVDDVASNTTTPFEVHTTIKDIASVEAYANLGL